MNPRYRHCLFASLLISISLAALASSAPPPTRELSTIDFGLRPLAFPSAIYAEPLQRDRILREELAKRGWNLKQHAFLAGSDVLIQLRSGLLKAAIVGDVPTVQALAGGEFIAVAITKHGFATVITRKIGTLAALRGKKIGNVAGTSAHYVLHEALASAGLSERDIELVEMPMSEMLPALASGKIDACAVWEPFATLARRNYPQFGFAYRGLSNDYLLIKRSLAERDPEFVHHLVAAVLRAHFWLKKQPANLEHAATSSLNAARTLAGGTLPLSRAELIHIARQDALQVSGLPRLPQREDIPAARLVKRLDFLKKTGKLDESVTWQDISGRFAPQPLETVIHNAQRYRIREYDYD